jgi:hypothetical protein
MAALTGTTTSDNKFYLLRARPLRWVASSVSGDEDAWTPALYRALLAGAMQSPTTHFGLCRRRHKPKRQIKSTLGAIIAKATLMRSDPNKTLIYTTKMPQVEDLKKHRAKFPVDTILKPLLEKHQANISFNPFDWSATKKSADLSALVTWIDNINTLTHDAYIANCHALFFLEEGIPDDPFRISPGRNGQSEQYFPNFEGQHYYNQSMFRFYAEITISKLFSTLDNVGSILMYHFGLYDISSDDSSKSYFHTAIPKIIQSQKIDGLEPLLKIIENPQFLKAKQIRNDILHNRTPLKLYSHFVASDNGKQRMLGSNFTYIPAKEVRSIVEFLIESVLEPSISITAGFL